MSSKLDREISGLKCNLESAYFTFSSNPFDMKSFIRSMIILLISSIFTLSCVNDEGGDIPILTDLLPSATSIAFDSVIVNEVYLQSYQLYASKLSGRVEVTLTDPSLRYSISKSQNSNFGPTVTLDIDEFENNLATIFVRFRSTLAGVTSNATIKHSTTGLLREPITELSGLAILDGPVELILPMDTLDLGTYNQGWINQFDASYDLVGRFLDGNVKVSVTEGPFTLATSGSDFSDKIEFLRSDFFGDEEATVLVKFSPSAPGVYTDTITHLTPGAEEFMIIRATAGE